MAKKLASLLAASMTMPSPGSSVSRKEAQDLSTVAVPPGTPKLKERPARAKKKSRAKKKAPKVRALTIADVRRVAEKKDRRTNVAEILDLPKSRRNVKPGSSLRALAKFGGTWTAADVCQLVRDNRKFAGFFVVTVTKTRSGRKGMSYKQSLEDAMNAIRQANPGARANWRSKALKLADELAKLANQSKVHPCDIAFAVMLTPIGNPAAADQKSVSAIYREMGWDGNAAAAYEKLITILSSLKKVARGMSWSYHPVLRETAKAIRALGNDLFKGFFKSKSLKPWKRGKGRLNGMEIMSFTYIVPDEFDDKGNAKLSSAKSFRHVCAAVEAERMAGSDNSAAHALRSLAAAGRLYLCVGEDGRGLCLASDRKPSRKVFLIREKSPRDAVINGMSVDDALTGFVI